MPNNWLTPALAAKYGFKAEDGPGPASFSTGFRDFFYFEAQAHDMDYLAYKNGRYEDEIPIDDRFLLRMQNRVAITGHWWRWPQAWAYYWLVRFFGPGEWGNKR